LRLRQEDLHKHFTTAIFSYACSCIYSDWTKVQFSPDFLVVSSNSYNEKTILA